ncbi:MAG: hypothetical protein JO302_07020 [Candidatus Eremiobacteraeota bacterium]|nr:hypothetical protein [Candidatus Eremiobacteraeota bacterium]
MNRNAFLSATLVAASSGAAIAQNVPGGTHFVERKTDFDSAAFDRLVGRSAQIRQIYEAVAFKPTLLNNVKNSFNGLQFGFGYSAGSIAIVLAGHGPSSVYAYTDYLWSKYRLGEFYKLSDSDGAPLTSNVFIAKRSTFDPNADPDNDKGMYQDTSIEMLQRRGLIVLTCHTAVEEQARQLVKKGFAASGMTPSDVAADVLTHLVEGAIVVPSMVATIAVLQATYHYTYLTLVA